MKYGLSVALILMASVSARAEDYRVVYSPSQELEVFIDNVSDTSPQSWCQKTLSLRIVAGKATDAEALARFLPQVGNLLTNQCATLQALPWQMTNGRGSVLAVGTALKTQNWQPVVTDGGTASAPDGRTASQEPSLPANTAPLQHFDLPGGCHFRTWWDNRGQSLFIPENKEMTCTTEGWLEGHSELSLAGQPLPLAVTFYQGYPLRHLHPATGELNVVSVNNQRMIVSLANSPDSWLILPFIPALHVWSFDGTLLIKMDRQQANDTAALKERVETQQDAWSPLINPGVKVNVLLVDALHDELADPTTGAWRTVN